jgi:hypothetical protein
VSFTIGVFDLFTHAVPGALYLTLLGVVADRSGWIDAADVDTSTLPALLAAAIGSYLIGHLTYDLGMFLVRRTPWHRSMAAEARREFRRRNPMAEGHDYVDADLGLLRAGIELRSADGKAEIARVHAPGLMLLNCAPCLFLGALVAGAVGAIDQSLAAACATGILTASSVAATFAGARLVRWAHLHTLELAFWMPDLGDFIAGQQPGGRADPSAGGAGEPQPDGP